LKSCQISEHGFKVLFSLIVLEHTGMFAVEDSRIVYTKFSLLIAHHSRYVFVQLDRIHSILGANGQARKARVPKKHVSIHRDDGWRILKAFPRLLRQIVDRINGDDQTRHPQRSGISRKKIRITH
jgi:hypothetical protein